MTGLSLFTSMARFMAMNWARLPTAINRRLAKALLKAARLIAGSPDASTPTQLIWPWTATDFSEFCSVRSAQLNHVIDTAPTGGFLTSDASRELPGN